MKKNDFILVCIYAALLLVGIWHGFPNLKIVADEAPFVGGVLRAIEAKTLVPEIDYSYTLSFYANYILMLPFLAGLFLFFLGNKSEVVSFLMENVYVAYFVPRLVSVLSAVVLLYVFLKLMSERGRSFAERAILSAIIFGNIIFFVIAHTGKMWMLSLLLWFLSFYFFEKKNYFWTPIFAFLSFANFPVNVISLLFPTWLWFEVLRNKSDKEVIVKGTVIGIVIFGILLALNWSGWTIQNSVTPVEGRSIVGVARYILIGAVTLMPIHLLYAIFCTQGKSLNKSVIALGLSLVGYIAILFLRAPWVGGGHPESYLRYFVYIGFIAGLILAYQTIHRQKLGIILALVSLIFVLRVDYLLAIPTTYNEARNYLLHYSNGILITNHLPYLDLPKDRESHLTTEDALCQSRCFYGRENDVVGGLRVIDVDAKHDIYRAVLGSAEPYLLVSTEEIIGSNIKALFKNNLASNDYMGVDHDLGPYFYHLFRIERLGQKIFIYSVN